MSVKFLARDFLKDINKFILNCIYPSDKCCPAIAHIPDITRYMNRGLKMAMNKLVGLIQFEIRLEINESIYGMIIFTIAPRTCPVFLSRSGYSQNLHLAPQTY